MNVENIITSNKMQLDYTPALKAFPGKNGGGGMQVFLLAGG